MYIARLYLGKILDNRGIKYRGPIRQNYPSNLVWTVLQLSLGRKDVYKWISKPIVKKIWIMVC